MKRLLLLLLSALLTAWLFTSCAPAAEPEIPAEEPTQIAAEEPVAEEPAAVEVEEPAEEEPVVVEEEVSLSTAVPSATPALQPTQGLPTSTAASTEGRPTPTALVEPRIVEVEWPGRLHLGDSDVVRLSLVPSAEGYRLTTEFPDHQAITQDVPIVRPAGYELFAISRLDGVGFTILPAVEQTSVLPIGQPLTWHWSLTPKHPGRHRLTISLSLRWEPLPGTTGSTREAVAYSKGLDVRVISFMGLSRGQALTAALIGLSLGGGAISLAVVNRVPFRFRRSSPPGTMPPRKPAAQILAPNPALNIETPAGLHLSQEEKSLLRSLFQRYDRLLVQQEFLSGYSGARTLLLTPIRSDGRADAATIAKIGGRSGIEREYRNYETFIKHTLPPVTARIQSPPVTLREAGSLAVIQYTFLGQPGVKPVSLRQALLSDPDPRMLDRLFETFGPNWWMQRRPWTFRLSEAYDRLLPPHAVLEPVSGRGKILDGRTPPSEANLVSGQRLQPRHFNLQGSQDSSKTQLTLQGKTPAGGSPLRLRWLDKAFTRTDVGRVVSTRMELLRSYTAGFDRLGLPDPLARLPGLLDKTVTGTRSTIHGDLNLENILIGPGSLIWLIDFATTREGHPLADFAHLETEIIAHVAAIIIDDPVVFLDLLHSAGYSLEPKAITTNRSDVQSVSKLQTLLRTLHKIAFTCLANPSNPKEYHLALFLSCLGALKYRNLDDHQKQFLYLTACCIGQFL